MNFQIFPPHTDKDAYAHDGPIVFADMMDQSAEKGATRVVSASQVGQGRRTVVLLLEDVADNAGPEREPVRMTKGPRLERRTEQFSARLVIQERQRSRSEAKEEARRLATLERMARESQNGDALNRSLSNLLASHWVQMVRRAACLLMIGAVAGVMAFAMFHQTVTSYVTSRTALNAGVVTAPPQEVAKLERTHGRMGSGVVTSQAWLSPSPRLSLVSDKNSETY